jgi:hypothetical protein
MRRRPKPGVVRVGFSHHNRTIRWANFDNRDSIGILTRRLLRRDSASHLPPNCKVWHELPRKKRLGSSAARELKHFGAHAIH